MNAEMELTAAALANRVIGGGEVTAEFSKTAAGKTSSRRRIG